MAQREFNWPINPTTVNSGPIQFEVDGSPVTVNVDTGTPANSTPLPVTILGPSGVPIDFNNDYGASSGGLRTAAQIGNSTGQADFNAGATGAQTLRVEANQGAAGGTPWPVTGPLTDTELRASPVPVSGPLTDTELRASPVDVSASQNGLWDVSVNNFPATQPISGTVSIDQTTPGTTNGVVVNSSALPTGAATEAKQDDEITALGLLATEATLQSILTDTGDISTTVQSIDTKTPALGQAAASASVPVVLASDQPAIPTKAPVNPNGTYAEIINLATTAQTLAAPANAVGFLLEALSDNTVNVRWKVGATATTSSGMRLEPGRDSGYIPVAADISVIAESGTDQVVTVQWILNQ